MAEASEKATDLVSDFRKAVEDLVRSDLSDDAWNAASRRYEEAREALVARLAQLEAGGEVVVGWASPNWAAQLDAGCWITVVADGGQFDRDVPILIRTPTSGEAAPPEPREMDDG